MVGILLSIARLISGIIAALLFLISGLMILFGIPLLLCGIIPGIICICGGFGVSVIAGLFWVIATAPTHDEAIKQEAQVKIDQAEHDREVQAEIDSR